MPMTIDLFAKTSTSITVQLASRTGGYATIDFQYSTRPDFAFGLAPLVTNLAPDGNARVWITELNQGNTYWVRFRERNGATVLAWTEPMPVYLALASTWDTTPLSIMVRQAIVVCPAAIRTWSAQTLDAGHPPANLGSDAPLEQFWTTGTYLDVETSGEPVDTIALLATNFPAAMTWSIKGADTQAGLAAGATIHSSVQFHASPNLPGRPHYNGLARLAAPTTWRWYRITWAAGTVPGGIACMTYLVLGLARTAKNIAADKVEAPLEYGAIERLRDGTPDRRYGFRGRRVDFEIALMTEAQWETQFADLRYKIGLTEPVLVVPNTRAGSFLHDRILYGPLSANRATQPHTPRFSQQFAIESLI